MTVYDLRKKWSSSPVQRLDLSRLVVENMAPQSSASWRPPRPVSSLFVSAWRSPPPFVSAWRSSSPVSPQHGGHLHPLEHFCFPSCSSQMRRPVMFRSSRISIFVPDQHTSRNGHREFFRSKSARGIISIWFWILILMIVQENGPTDASWLSSKSCVKVDSLQQRDTVAPPQCRCDELIRRRSAGVSLQVTVRGRSYKG